MKTVSTFFKKYRLAGKLALCGYLFVLTSCDDPIELDISELRQISFAKNMRVNLGIISTSDLSNADKVSDGQSSNAVIISPLVPAGIPADGTFPDSPLYWIPAGEDSSLSYETIFFRLRFDGIPTTLTQEPFSVTTPFSAYSVTQPYQPGRTHLSFNGYGVMTPGDSTDSIPGDRRMAVALYDGDEYILHSQNPIFDDGFYLDIPGHTIAIEQCTGTVQPNEFDLPLRPSETCTRVDMKEFCEGGFGNGTFMPWRVYGCRFETQEDASYSLHAVASSDLYQPYDQFNALPNTAPQGWTPILPALKVVSSPRTLVRELTFEEEICIQYDPSGRERGCTIAQMEELDFWRHCQGRYIEPGGPIVDLSTCPVNLYPPGANDDGDGYSQLKSIWRYDLLDQNGNYQEQFSPELRVDNIRLFTLNQDGSRNYALSDESFSADVILGITGTEPFEIEIRRNAVASTTLRLMTSPGVWEDLQVDHVIIQDLPIEPSNRVFIEFDLRQL